MDGAAATRTRAKSVVVIGAGLGGISAAISLAQEGYNVRVLEKNAKIGGKLNFLEKEGYTFDLGPSILTLPHLFERLFERSGKRMSDYVTIRPLRPHWRNFFEDGTTIDLTPERDAMAVEAAKAGEVPETFEAFLRYAERLFDLVDEGYFKEGLDTFREIVAHYGVRRIREFDVLHSMHGAIHQRLKSPYMRDIMEYFIKYVGSSAYDAPAFMNCLPTIQYRHDLWYVDGGMYNLARGLERLLLELGVEIRVDAEVTAIEKDGARATGVRLASGESIEADIIVSNMEVLPSYRDLLDEPDSFLRTLRRFEPACSGLVLELGLDTTYPQLAHHNFFYARDQSKHFHSVFREHKIPEDPTIYLVAASRTDPTVAPKGCDCLKILPHIPCINDDDPLPHEAYLDLKERVLDKLERMGLTDLRKHIVVEHVWTPVDIRRQYYSTRGSIYGVAAQQWKNFGFKFPKQSPRYPNLFFVGGTVNPGGGMPMVVLCGQNVCKRVLSWDQE